MIYSFFIFLFYAALRFSSIWNPKARAWLEGRVQWRSTLKAVFPVAKIGKQVWIHCASLGEFEQGRPIIEAIRSKWPDTKIILTFFAPSGYEVRKNYAEVDFVCYLPLDTKKNARDFLD
ncbi:MAG: 3-deoxy-D-manno-octulosonic acid transferase, partial [Sphingobacteriales bacterium]